MGIKTIFNPLGGSSSSSKENLSEWYYNTYSGQTPGIELKVYAGFGANVVVPKKNTILQDYVNSHQYGILYSNNGTYSPSDLSAIPDHLVNPKFTESGDMISITNSTGTVNYYGSDDYRKNTFTILLPKDWTEIIVNTHDDTQFLATYYESPFYNKSTIVNVDLQHVPWCNNSMYNAFVNCSNLVLIENINESVTNMSNTFMRCSNLNQNIQIPNSVTNMFGTFIVCTNLNQNIQIPNSVVSMISTFASCENLNQNIQIPNSVTDMSSTFSGCYNLNQNIQIPNSVTDISGTFRYCYNLNQNIQIPNSVTNMYDTFIVCTNLNQNIQIPNSVTNMSSTFFHCSNFDSWINILSTNITCATSAFNTANDSCIPNVFIVYKYLNDAITPTWTAINSAGWKINGQGAIVGTSPNRIRTWDDGANYGTRTYNGTHCILSGWVGQLDTFLNNNVTWTTPQVPQRLFLSNIPVALNRACFKANAQITGIDLGTDIPWLGDQIGTGTNSSNRNAACRNCFNLTYARGVIAEGTTDASATFDRCYNIRGQNLSIVWPDSITKWYTTYEMVNCTDVPPLGENAANIQSICFSANSLTNYPVIPPKVTAMTTAFSNGASASARGNIFILSPSIASANAAVAGAFFRGYNASNRRDIYIPYQYSNGTSTTTYTTFTKNAIYRGTSGNGANPMYNSTSNIYVHNLSSHYDEIWNSYTGTTSTTLLEYNKAQQITHLAIFPKYPDYNVTTIGNNCFRNASYLKTLALYSRPFNSTNVSYAFDNCRNIQVIQGLNLAGTVNMEGTFNNCTNLQVCRGIPDSVTSMVKTFNGCHYLNFNVQIGNGVTNMYSTFSNCYNLNQNIQIPNSVTNMYGTFDYCFNLNQNIQIPDSVIDMTHTFSGCSNLNQNIQIGNSVVDMDYAFLNCKKLNQDIRIPSSVTSLTSTFINCVALQGNIQIMSEEVTTASSCFGSTTAIKNVYIPFKYANGVNTKTFNSFKSAGYLDANGISTNQHGAVIHDLN